MNPSPLHSEVLPGGTMWSKIIGRNKRLRLTDIDGTGNVGLLLYNASERQERYNMPDTLKGQHVFFLTHPLCIHSDMGRLLASVTADTAGWHDTVCGCSNADLVAKKYGTKTYQEARNAWHRNARECFMIELGKWGLGERDLVPNLNLFSKVVADDEGRLTFDTTPTPGTYIELRFEMDTLVVLNTCQHPLDPNPLYKPGAIQLEVFSGEPSTRDDPCIQSRPENLRAWETTQVYQILKS